MLKTIKFHHQYFPFSEATPENFFRDAISNSSIYRRSAGYFSSSVLHLFKLEYFDFALRGGKIDLICSNQLANEDINILTADSDEPHSAIIRQINELDMSDQPSDPLDFFSALIRAGVLNIKIAQYKNGGMFHDKTGSFEDNDRNIVTFRGSANETYMGWANEGNFETIETFCSWRDSDIERVNGHQNYLSTIWSNEQPGLVVVPPSDLMLTELKKRSRKEIDDFRETFEKRKERDKKEVYQSQTVPPKRALFEFQKQVLNDWEQKSFKGIIKHATGSGKTVTAIWAIYNHIINGNATLVLVPSVLLLNQWRDEILKDIPNAIIQLCGDSNTSWKKPGRLNNLFRPNKNGIGAIIIAIMDTASSKNFISKVNYTGDLLLIADEAHNLGAPSKVSLTTINFKKRLGLSATPERYRDPEGTTVIFNFLGDILKPEISIKDAIDMGRLVNYVYYPVPALLDSIETDEYRELTSKIVKSQISDETSSHKTDTEFTKILRLQRSRIIKKAAVKIPLVVDLLSNNFEDGQYWLLYCEDTDQLNELNDRLREVSIKPHIYTTTLEGSKKAELSDYEKRGGVMLSIGCLDEGVDIPKISHAVILASSQNPRQFIQRRGRVLRKDGTKEKALIYDMFVFPNSENRNLSTSLSRAELTRANEFANNALNHLTAMNRVKQIFIDWGVNMEEYLSESNQP